LDSLYESCHQLGGMANHTWEHDPKRLSFVLARYKFVAKMFEGKNRVVEVGCSDGFGSRIVRQHVQNLDAVDIDEKAIEEAKKNNSPRWPVNYFVHDILKSPVRSYDAVYCLDVFEHIEDERWFLFNLRRTSSVCIIGTPSLESQRYASELSRKGHVNCKSGEDLKKLLQGYWNQVFMFGMNDEVVHTGFLPMSHYLFALCISEQLVHRV
jgi:2-polyprenyl-3-methyl-5-hydroxy-6-metoxy-1,4-benzoquinol methylase